jgi:hypothetical protein
MAARPAARPGHNFLQQHYNRARDAGVTHGMYVVANEIDDDKALCAELLKFYNEREPAREPA